MLDFSDGKPGNGEYLHLHFSFSFSVHAESCTVWFHLTVCEWPRYSASLVGTKGLFLYAEKLSVQQRLQLGRGRGNFADILLTPAVFCTTSPLCQRIRQLLRAHFHPALAADGWEKNNEKSTPFLHLVGAEFRVLLVATADLNHR